MNRDVGGVGRLGTRRMLALVAGFALLLPLGVLAGVVAPDRAEAANTSDFDPGHIISDDLFYDGAAMTASEIQSFLDGKIGTCLTERCLNVAVLPVTGRPASYSADTGGLVCSAIAGGTLRVSELIYRTQVACGISAKVILVTLQKEQGLVTNRAPSDWALRAAMGMGCPDTAPCDDAFAGLATQIMVGSRQLKVYKVGGFARQPGTHFIQYHPNAACGGTSVNVRNHATAALYNYTPYQPNAAALANLNGTGDSCSSYGNRNFWRFYTDWFGSTSAGPPVSSNALPYLVARTASGELLLYRSTGKGAWHVPAVIGSGWEGMRHIVVGGDFTGDRLRDILAVGSTGDLYLYKTDGFAAITESSLVGSGWGDIKFLIAPGDVSGDGRQDLVAVDSAGVLRLYPGNGSGGFGTARVISTAWASATSVIGVGDFSGDGKPDLMSIESDGALRLHAGDGAGGFGQGVQIGSGWESMAHVLGIRDFDGDGRADVLGVDRSGGLWFYGGDGNGRWRSSGKVGHGWNGMTAIAAAGPAGTFVAPRTPLPTGFGDLNGDRVRDIIAIASSGKLYAYRGRGDGSIGASFVMPGDWSSTRFVGAVGDYDGDGMTDGLSVDDAGDMWKFSVNFANGFTDRVLYNTGWDAMTTVLTPGDLDGDGVADVVGVDQAGKLWFYPGPIATRREIGSGWGTLAEVLAPGDFDGDGYSDLIGRTASGELLLYRGNGAAGWHTARTIGSGWQIFDSLHSPGDFDGDGKTDILARKPNGDLWIYPTDGKGGWKQWRQIGSGWEGMRWIG